MKQIPATQLKLYYQLTRCSNLAEVELSYKSKVKPSMREKIVCSRDTYDILKRIYDDTRIEHVEEFYVLMLNRGNNVMGWIKISEGGISSTTADVRIIFQAALLSNATSIVISHNHPSGNLQPSNADIQLTRKVKEAGKLLDIELMDHVIVSTEAYYSFADEGML